jgi:hypothetical protein
VHFFKLQLRSSQCFQCLGELHRSCD